MDRFIHQIVGVIFMSTLVFACSSPKNNKKGTGEPNNSILKAGLLKPGKSYTTKIDSVGDVDWFAVPVPGQGYLNISTKNTPKNLDFRVRFAQKQEWKQKKQKWTTHDRTLPATIPISKPDTVYFVFKDKYGKNASKKDIAFKADFIKEFDRYEDNNVADSAKTVATGKPIASAFFPKTDVDWFKTKVDSSGYLMVQARNIPEDINVEVHFAKKPDDYSKAKNISGGLGLPAAIQVTEPGVYYFSLKDKYNSKMSRDKAEWKIGFISEIDSTEPNNKFDEAYRLAVNDTVKTAIFPKKDTDYFTLAPDSNSTLRLAAKHPKNLTPEIKLYTEKDFKQEPVGDWQKLPTKIEVEAGQKYYIRLHTKYDNAYSKKPVLFSVSQIGAPTDKMPKTQDKVSKK